MFLIACHVQAVSWGFIDLTTGNGGIILNGLEALRTRWNDGHRGFNVIELAVDKCSSSSYHHFDTCDTTQNGIESTALANYINNLPQSTVLVGVTADEASVGLTDVAMTALRSIGVDVSTLLYRGCLSFVAQVGRPIATVMKLMPIPSIDALVLNVTVSRNGNGYEFVSVRKSCIVFACM